jgi:hypothetical protein
MSNAKITNKMQKKICVLIKTWEGKFTWGALEKAILHDYSFSVTRQTLQDYDAIKTEYDLKKQEKRGITNVRREIVSADKAKLIKKIEKLEAELALSEKTTATQLSFIEDVISNARTMNVNLQKLLESRR